MKKRHGNTKNAPGACKSLDFYPKDMSLQVCRALEKGM